MITPIFQERLYQYLGGALRNKDAVCLEIGGVSDHIHVLAGIPPSIAVADLIRDLKVSSTKWLQQTVLQRGSFAWQEGYGAFSVSRGHIDPVAQYIRNQEKHHKNVSFREEFLRILDKNGVKYDEKYLWK
jgi:putative transposase